MGLWACRFHGLFALCKIIASRLPCIAGHGLLHIFFLYHMVIGVICIVWQTSLQRRVLRTLLCCEDLQGRLVI
ncbi:unnamed protein product [Mycena citricolor]|uniref:Uncharacterized protein n=1 Tax=Mycena citricolor TaxID=2018698 RepID=A0AAD2HI09_9AGAR|nr:unnamed protein product [Mycena citricolor]